MAGFDTFYQWLQTFTTAKIDFSDFTDSPNEDASKRIADKFLHEFSQLRDESSWDITDNTVLPRGATTLHCVAGVNVESDTEPHAIVKLRMRILKDVFCLFAEEKKSDGSPVIQDISDVADDDGETLMHYATRAGNLDIMSYLVEKTSSTDDTNSSSTLPLINLPDSHGMTPFLLASREGEIEILTHLLKLAKEHSSSSEMVDGTEMSVITDGVSEVVMATDEGGMGALHYAASSGSVECFKFLLSLKNGKGTGGSINLDPAQRDNEGTTVLHYAAESGNLELVRYLAEEVFGNRFTTAKDSSSAPNSFSLADANGQTPLVFAVLSGQPKVVDYCVQNIGCDVRLTSKIPENGEEKASPSGGNTVLHYAVIGSGSVGMYTYLVDKYFSRGEKDEDKTFTARRNANGKTATDIVEDFMNCSDDDDDCDSRSCCDDSDCEGC